MVSKPYKLVLITVLSALLLGLFGRNANADHATLKVVNTTSWNIVGFYASPYWHTTYNTGNLLGNYVIGLGEYWYVDLSDGRTDNCIYDVKVVLQNGMATEIRKNVCGTTLTVYER